MATDNAAVHLLEQKILDLTKGLNGIEDLKERLKAYEESVKLARRQLKEQKKALIEYRTALELLKAGEEN